MSLSQRRRGGQEGNDNDYDNDYDNEWRELDIFVPIFVLIVAGRLREVRSWRKT